MPRLKLALAQMRSEKGDWAGNLERVERYMAQASAQGCDIVVFPEMSLSGYCDPTRFPESVQPLDSEWIERFVRLTGQYGITASAGFIEANPHGKPFITQVLAQDGCLIGSYRKRHIVDEEADWFSAGDYTPVFHLLLPQGEVDVALAVCADSDNSAVFADAARGGAQIVLHSSAPGLYGRRTDEASWQEGFDWYKSHLRERLPRYAREHGLYIAVATQTGSTVDEDFPGGSFVFGPEGECLLASPDWAEMLLVCNLDIPEREDKR
jgi:predicted amidohydrolase